MVQGAGLKDMLCIFGSCLAGTHFACSNLKFAKNVLLNSIMTCPQPEDNVLKVAGKFEECSTLRVVFPSF